MGIQWRIELLGGLRAVRGEQIVTRFQTQQAGVLLAYLAYYRQRSHLREALIDLLWPDCEPDVGRHRLSVALSALRQRLEPLGAAGGTVIVADRASVRLNPEAISTDVVEFEAALQAAARAGSPSERADALDQAVALYRGELLPGAYDDWVLQEREWLAERFFQALEQLIAHLEAVGELNRALEIAHRGVSADPLREEAHAVLMRLYAAAGQPAAALRQYRELERLLQEQLETTPTPATRALVREIERLSLLRPQPVVAPKSPARPSVASSRAPLAAPAEGENRLVTVLFADMSRSVETTRDLDPEDAAELMNRLLSVMVDALLKYEGRIDRFLGDGVLAVFGTLQAHEDDPERAIRAALEIREAARKLGLEVTAGINTGTVYVGAVGSERHQETTVVGPVVNLAARLQEQAEPGEILVGEATYRQTRRAFTFASRSLAIKGLPQPVAAYAVESALPRPEKARGIEGLQAELIGRDEELAKLQAALAELGHGRGQMVSLIGEAGIGKSRLVAELRGALTPPPCPPPRSGEGGGSSGAEMSFSLPRFGEGPGERSTPLWLEGRCLELGMTASYSLFVDLFHDTFAWRPEEAEPERVARLITSIQEFVARGDLSAERADEIGPLLGNLLSLRFGNDWDLRLKNTDPEHLKHQTLLAVRDFFVALAKQQPVLLVLEDLHWADSLSLDVISLLMEALAEAPLLLLCVYRPEREQKSVRLGSIASRKCPERYTELLLRELTPSQSRHLVASLLTIEELPSSVRELILEKAHGNPFFLEEVVHSLIDAGLVYREGEVWRAREEIASVTVPESVQSVIRSRVDRLGPELKRVLQTASVMGRLFRRRVLEHTVQTASSGAGGGLAPEALERALWELEERALIYQERMVREEEYSFKHVLTQETVYQSILRRHRAVLHQQVGDAIEALYPERLEEHAERLAYHYERSGADEKAIEYLLKAGEKARRAFLNEAALGYFRRALARLDAAPETSARPAWRQETAALLHEGLGDVQHLLGQYDEARAAFQDALAHLPEQERLRRARLERKIGDTWLPQLRCEEALRACDRAEAALGPAPAGADAEWWQAWADLQMDRFSALYRLRQTEALLALAEQIRPVVEQYGTPAQRGNFLIRLGIVSQQRDRYVISDETLAYARAALAAMEETRDLRQIAEARFVVGSYLLFRGELEEAEAQLQAALGLAERTGDLWSRVIHLTYLTVLYRRRGQLKEVREYAERSLAAATAAQSAMYVGMAKANLAWLAWRSGNPSEAQEYGRAALELWPARGHFLEGLALWPLMGVALGREQMAEAVEYGRALLAPTQQALPDPIRAQVEAALEAQEQGQPERARAHLCQAMARARDMGYA